MYSYFKFVKHILLIGLLHGVGVIQSLIFLPLITKILGAEDYGIWVQLKATMSLLIPFAYFGLSDALLRFLAVEKDIKKIQEGVYSTLVFVSATTLAMALLLVIFSGQVAVLFHFDSVFIKLVSLLIIFESLSAVLLIVLQARREIEKYFWFSNLKMFGETGAVICAVALGFGLYGAFLSLLFIKAAIFLILFAYIVKKIGIKVPDFSLIKDYLRFGLPIMTNSFTYWVISSFDRYAIGFILGIVFVGYYAPAYSIGMLLVFFIIPINSILSVVLPKFFDDNNLDEVKKYLNYSLKYFLLVMIPAVFGISILSHQLLEILSTKEIADNAYFVIPFIGASMIVYGIYCFISHILVLVKKTKLAAMIWAAGALVNFVLNIILIPKFGIVAAAVITFLSYFCVLILTWHFAFKEFKFKIDWNFMAKSFIASALMILPIWQFNPKGIFNVSFSIIFGVIMYGSLIFLFRTIGKKEIIFFRELINRALKSA